MTLGHYWHPESAGGRKDEAGTVAGISASSFLQCFDTVGWATERTSRMLSQRLSTGITGGGKRKATG